MKKVVCMICLLLVGGSCWNEGRSSSETKAWYNPKRTFEQCCKDFIECDHKAVRRSYSTLGLGSVILRVGFCGECMEARGYKLVPVKKIPAETRRISTGYGNWEVAGR